VLSSSKLLTCNDLQDATNCDAQVPRTRRRQHQLHWHGVCNVLSNAWLIHLLIMAQNDMQHVGSTSAIVSRKKLTSRRGAEIGATTSLFTFNDNMAKYLQGPLNEDRHIYGNRKLTQLR